mmetsp:Transcript_16343/g.38802  ORF Transcript_16343/g.38802 Transcript_16343/m.38802 type:complete len:81 (+) Transcript_16343:637-879(+)
MPAAASKQPSPAALRSSALVADTTRPRTNRLISCADASSGVQGDDSEPRLGHRERGSAGRRRGELMARVGLVAAYLRATR